MTALSTRIDGASREFLANREAMDKAVDDLHRRLTEIRLGGGEAARKRHTERGKLLPARADRSRCSTRAQSFRVLSVSRSWRLRRCDPLRRAHHGNRYDCRPRLRVVANDATVKGGTYYPPDCARASSGAEIAMENRLPCVYLVDSGGAFLPLQDQVFPGRDHFGRYLSTIRRRCRQRAFRKSPPCLGSCTAGGAYIPAMCEQSIIVKGQGTNLSCRAAVVKAATGETISAEELGGADTHARLSGVVDYVAKDDADAMRQVAASSADWRRPQRAPFHVKQRRRSTTRKRSTALCPRTYVGFTTYTK
jgi:3-methylcrotonyl-CoA carboxylase beta subunit